MTWVISLEMSPGVVRTSAWRQSVTDAVSLTSETLAGWGGSWCLLAGVISGPEEQGALGMNPTWKLPVCLGLGAPELNRAEEGVSCWPSTVAPRVERLFQEAQALGGRARLSQPCLLSASCHLAFPQSARPPLAAVAAGVGSPTESPLLEPSTPPAEPEARPPIRSQPEARTPPSPASPQRQSPPTQLPICSQPQPSPEATVPSPTLSPIRSQPVPARTSTPLAPLPMKNQGVTKDTLGSPLPGDEALKRSDLVAEFWMKSAEIRRSLGLTPVHRSPGSEPAFQSPPLKAYPAEKGPQSEGLRLLKPPPVPRKLGLPAAEGAQPCPPTPVSPPDREPKGPREEHRDLSSSSGLGLQGSSSRTRTPGSQSFNTSDSTMLTPPSSPPPPPPDEEPATLHRKPALAGQPVASAPPPPAVGVRPPREPAQPPQEEARKSFVESVDEIPFADDVEDTYDDNTCDDRTEDSSLQETFFTPPSHWPHRKQPLAPENGRGLESGVPLQKRGLPLVSAEAKELAAERMRAREKSVRSQALRDAMARQLSRMKEMDIAAAAPRTPAPRRAAAVPSKGPEELASRHEATSEEVLSPPSDSGGPDGSVTSSEGSSGKSKKRSSLFSPRRSKKEKKPKGEGRPLERPSPGTLEEAAAKPRSLWKSVFSGYRKDKKKKSDGQSCPSTPSSGTAVDAGKPRASPISRAGSVVHAAPPPPRAQLGVQALPSPWFPLKTLCLCHPASPGVFREEAAKLRTFQNKSMAGQGPRGGCAP